MAKDLPVQRQLMGGREILDASLWRLAGWSQAEIDRGLERVEGLVHHSSELQSEHPFVADFLQSCKRAGDRRDAWSALCALVVLWADSRDDKALYFRAGFEVLASYRQAKNGHVAPKSDALDELILSYLRLHPGTTSAQLWDHCTGLARHRMIVEEATDACLTYRVYPGDSRLKTVRFRAFEVRVSRIRKRTSTEKPALITPAEPSFSWPSLQPVVVSSAF